ncbi:hypothetical protein Tco_0846795 [Tanacetum coccineum]
MGKCLTGKLLSMVGSGTIGIKRLLVLLKLLLLVIVSTTGEVQGKYSKWLILLVQKLRLLVEVTAAQEVQGKYTKCTVRSIYHDDQKSDKGNDENEIDMIQSLGGNDNTNKLLEESQDKIIKVFIMGSFIMGLNVNIVAWNHFVNGMLFILIKNLYVSFGNIDLQEWIRRIWVKPIRHMAPLPPRDQRHLWLCYQVVGYTKEIVHDFEQRLETIFGRQVNRVHILDFEGLTLDMRHDLAKRMMMVYTGDDGQELGGARRSMTWRQFILALGFHTTEEMTEDEFGAYWLGSERLILDKGDLSDYWVKISSDRDFLRGGGRHLKRHAEGRKSGAKLSGGHFIRRLAHHFGLVSDDGLRGLSVVARELPLIDMGELVAADGAPEAAEDAPIVDEGVTTRCQDFTGTYGEINDRSAEILHMDGFMYDTAHGGYRADISGIRWDLSGELTSPAIFQRTHQDRGLARPALL